MGTTARKIVAGLTVGAAMLGSTAASASADTAPITGWHEVSSQHFTKLDVISRGQGIATDGSSLFFSGTPSLLRTELDGITPLASLPDAIPDQIKALDGLHIGDIDYYDGKVYAPIEGKPDYLHPFIALFDAKTLRFTGRKFALDQSLLTKGVPWVAIDAARQEAYTAEWDNTKVLNVHRLSDFKVIRTVTLSETLGRIQGAKVYDGLLYAARDNENLKSIVAINPDTGVVSHVFDRNIANAETEGLAFLPTPTTVKLLALENNEDDLTVYLRTYEAPRPRITKARLQSSRVRSGKPIRLGLNLSGDSTLSVNLSRCRGKVSHERPCPNPKDIGLLKQTTVKAGDTRLTIKPRVGGRKLKEGRYRVVLSAVGANGASSVTVDGPGFSIFKPETAKQKAGRMAAASALQPITNWQEVSKETFIGLDGIHRQQGVATDGRSMYFTYNTGVIRTRLDGTTIETENLDAIPDELKALGSGHIGDPDVYKGKLLLPIENNGYSHPYIAVFDAKTLQYTGVKYAVPGGGVDPQIDGHIGWIAVDPERGYAYYSNWEGAGTDILRVLDLDDFSFVKNVQLSQMVENNQGAAIYNGILYASQDVYPEYPILAINPATGSVRTAFNRNFPPFISGGAQSEAEAEGLAVLDTGKCVAMYVIEVAGAGGLSLRGYTPNGVPIPKAPGTSPPITGLNLKPRRVKRGKSTEMRFKISKPASATVRISKYKAGSDPCAKTKTLGVVSSQQVKKGKARLKIRTKIKGKNLAPGTYQLSLTAADRSGNINDSKKSILSIIR